MISIINSDISNRERQFDSKTQKTSGPQIKNFQDIIFHYVINDILLCHLKRLGRIFLQDRPSSNFKLHGKPHKAVLSVVSITQTV